MKKYRYRNTVLLIIHVLLTVFYMNESNYFYGNIFNITGTLDD